MCARSARASLLGQIRGGLTKWLDPGPAVGRTPAGFFFAFAGIRREDPWMSTTQKIYRTVTKGDYTIEVVRGQSMPRVAIVLVTAAGEVRAQLFAIAGFGTEDVFERAELWLAHFCSNDYSVKRIQMEIRIEGEASR